MGIEEWCGPQNTEHSMGTKEWSEDRRAVCKLEGGFGIGKRFWNKRAMLELESGVRTEE